jgi:ketosteroid isomerase-like protein
VSSPVAPHQPAERPSKAPIGGDQGRSAESESETPSGPVGELAAAYSAAWAARDLDRILALHSEDTRFHLHVGGPELVGREAVRAGFAGLLARWPDLAIEEHRLLGDEAHWALDWTLHAGRAADGAAATRIRCLDLVELSPDGLVARKDTFVDPADLGAALAEPPRTSTAAPKEPTR